MLFILLLNSFLIFIVHVFILFIYYVISLVCYFYFILFFKSFAICELDNLVEYRNRQQQPGYAAEMRRLIWAFVFCTRKKNHFVTTWQIHKYYLPLSCLGSFMYAIECSVRFASCIRFTNKTITYVFLVFVVVVVVVVVVVFALSFSPAICQ